MSDYISTTPEQVRQMLAQIGVKTMDDLFCDIQPHEKPRSFNLPPGMDEWGVRSRVRSLASRNTAGLISFLGAGVYDHFIPSVVDHLSGRSEFYTAYTPYQPECSQGTLQAIYEYQSAICRLTGMDLSNASLYDGATALYEAMIMARRITGRSRILIDECVHPLYRKVLRTYTRNLPLELIEIPPQDLGVNRGKIKELIDEQTACLITQNPNFFGVLDDFSDLADVLHKAGALLVMSVYPLSLGLVKTPCEMNADLTTGEGQSLGIPLSFGGPYLGFIAAKKEFSRKMPGRIVGRTVDHHGQSGFVLTLQAREQHIRREKATSNICSNEALCAMRALVYLCCLGKEGFQQAAMINHAKAEYAKNLLTKIKGVKLMTDLPTFNEFTLQIPARVSVLVNRLFKKGMMAGLPLDVFYPSLKNGLLVNITEKHTHAMVEELAREMEKALWS